MIIANEKRKTNIVEYLLYMWQVEDLIRANDCDMTEIDKNIISKYEQPDEVILEIRDWWGNLVEMMKLEQKQKAGHLQININTLQDIYRLHLELLKSSKEVAYSHIFNATLPFIKEFDTKSGHKHANDIEACITAIYSGFLLKLQGQDISEGTQEALQAFGKVLSFLSAKYKEEQEGELKLN